MGGGLFGAGADGVAGAVLRDTGRLGPMEPM